MVRVLLLVAVLPFLFACSPGDPPDNDDAVRHIGIYVNPYYVAASTPQGRPRVEVGQQFDRMLASAKQQDIVRVRNMIDTAPDLVTPMTMMVLAIRLYDVGLRDDAVFWFYVAKDRFMTMMRVLDTDHPALAQPVEATLAFNTLAGPFINGYAFCDPAKQREIRREALSWVEQSPYQALFLSQLPARPGDRAANLRLAIAELREAVDQEYQYFEDPENLAEFTRVRQENNMDALYCWS
jgi:hypothetical protein